MKWFKRILVVVALLVIAGSWFVIITRHNNASNKRTTLPAPVATPRVTVSAVPADLRGDVPTGADFNLFDYTNGAIDTTTQKQWAQAALRSERWREYAIANHRSDILKKLATSTSFGASDKDLAAFLDKAVAQNHAVTVTGAPQYGAVSIYKLNTTQKVAFAKLGVSIDDEYAIVLTMQGPVTATVVGDTAATPVSVVPKQVNYFMPGSVVSDPDLGDIWLRSYRVACGVASGDLTLSQICFGE